MCRCINNEMGNGNVNEYVNGNDTENETDCESSICESDIDVNEIVSNNNNKYNIVLCEIFNPSSHGFDNNSDPNIQGHHLVHTKFKKINWQTINGIIPNYKKHLLKNSENNGLNIHPLIRNYKTIISNNSYIKPEIAKVIYLSGGECVAILKTVWIRILQRTWRRKFINRQLQ